MQITLNYKLEGEHTLCHLIKFSFDRTLELYTRITVLQCPTNIASVYDSNFKLNFPKLFIGLRESYYKVKFHLKICYVQMLILKFAGVHVI